MIYLISQLLAWLFLTAAFAALAGWAFAAQRNAPRERALRRERDNLLRDLIAMATGEAGAANDEVERDRNEEALKGQLAVRDARISELEQHLERARGGVDEAASELAELRRRVEKADADAQELERLRALDEARERQQLLDARVEPAGPDNEEAQLQAWRLRYFEQRVRYLESLGRPEPAAALMPPAPVAPAPLVADAPSPDTLAANWRAREAEARAAFLEREVRTLAGAAPEPAPPGEANPFAANADIDTLLRWRLLYLERRAAHLQGRVARSAQEVSARHTGADGGDAASDPDRWKWRAHYLEARVRHLEQQLADRSPLEAPQPARPPYTFEPADEDRAEPRRRPPADRPRRKPPVLAAPRDGVPDDLTLIEGVSAMQQSTLYSIGIYHFDQIAAWSVDNVAWVDEYLRLRGRIEDEDWVEQAAAIARELAHS